jgi:hypothetical protein
MAFTLFIPAGAMPGITLTNKTILPSTGRQEAKIAGSSVSTRQGVPGTLNENPTSAQLAKANGACSQSMTGTICSINVGSLLTHVAICQGGQVVDTACLDLGCDCLLLNERLTVTQISEGGETFLDAVAKRIRVGDTLTTDTIELLGQLVAETIVNLVCRKKPPQVSQRLLNTDSELLRSHYSLQKCVLSGRLETGGSGGCRGLRPALTAGLMGALRDRNIEFQLVPEAPNIVAEGI